MIEPHNCDLAIGPIRQCQICGSADRQHVIDLGFSAPCDSLLTRDQLSQPETTFPLNLFRCRACGLVQIDHVVDPRHLFHREYPYRSGITETLKRHLHATSARVADKLAVPRGSLTVDIGSNDGTVLQGFKNVGMQSAGRRADQHREDCGRRRHSHREPVLQRGGRARDPRGARARGHRDGGECLRARQPALRAAVGRARAADG